MSLSSSINVACSGMDVNQNRLQVIANNIANTNTTAYKANRASFSTQALLTDSPGSAPTSDAGGANPSQRGLGAMMGGTETDFTQGTVNPTGIDTDMAIDGEGYFVVRSDTKQLYTRDGSFTFNSDHKLVTNSGQFVQGYAVDANGNPTGSLGDLTIPIGHDQIWKATQNVAFKGNLNSVTTGDSGSANIDVYDSTGAQIPLSITTSLQGTSDTGSTWDFTVQSPNLAGGSQAGTITFDTGGNMTGSTGAMLTLTGSNGTPQSVYLNFASMTAVNQGPTKDSTLVMNTQDGYGVGTLKDFTVGTDGMIQGQYDNGQFRNLGQVALATFTDPNGLDAKGGNLFAATSMSGEAKVGAPQTNGAGAIRGASLEASNVDLSREFVDMIVASSGFANASKMMTTSNQMLSDLLQAVR